MSLGRDREIFAMQAAWMIETPSPVICCS